MGRFQIRRGHSRRCAWVVEDTSYPAQEDAVLYFFRSRAAAQDFVACICKERGL